MLAGLAVRFEPASGYMTQLKQAAGSHSVSDALDSGSELESRLTNGTSQRVHGVNAGQIVRKQSAGTIRSNWMKRRGGNELSRYLPEFA